LCRAVALQPIATALDNPGAHVADTAR
jgi:hypothetical protein